MKLDNYSNVELGFYQSKDGFVSTGIVLQMTTKEDLLNIAKLFVKAAETMS